LLSDTWLSLSDNEALEYLLSSEVRIDTVLAKDMFATGEDVRIRFGIGAKALVTMQPAWQHLESVRDVKYVVKSVKFYFINE